MDWEKFSFEYHLDQQGFFQDLISIEAYRQASLNLVLSPEWQHQLDKLNRIRAVHGTTAIEGNPLSEAEVSQQMDYLEKQTHNHDRKTATKEQLQIRNAGEAQDWVRQRFRPNSPPIGLRDILTMHERITQDSDTVNNIPGKLRNFSVTVGTEDLGGIHRGAPHETLPRLMKEYIDFINSRQLEGHHQVIRALLAHFFLVTIHPFGDGNGRVSRLVEASILFQLGYNVHGFYGLSNYFYRHEQKYKSILQQCRQSQPFDVTPFIRFGVGGFASELEGINNFIKARINRLIYQRMLVQARDIKVSPRRRLLNQREYNLLNFLLRETEPSDPFSETPSRRIELLELLQDRYLQSAYQNVTRRTFLRELTRLRELGFIKFTLDDVVQDWVVELDFGAISKY
ncbi:MAG: Fic family protein [Gemmatimonadetes bacterium]|nr:Fic family protein [Gemmatimonadota bacterium]